MTIKNEVAGLDPTVETAITTGLTIMGVSNVDVIVTMDFIPTVQKLTGNSSYHVDRGGGDVAARTCTSTNGDIFIVVNWNAMKSRTLHEIERVLAHESGHVLIDEHGEEPYEDLEAQLDDTWELNTAYIVGMAVEEYRCETAAYKAGYPVENSHTDSEVEGTLVGLNIASIAAKSSYQSHKDPGQVRRDIIAALSDHTKNLACLAARHVHAEPFTPTNLSRYGRANWVELVAPTWTQLLHLFADVPDAATPWPSPAPTNKAIAGLPVMNVFCESLGYKAEPDHFWITLDDLTFQERLDRANAETGYFDNN